MHRKLYKSLQTWKSKSSRKPLIVRGVRQCGKTHLLKEFGKTEFQKSHYFNFEEDGELSPFFSRNLKAKRILSELEFHSGTVIDPKTDLLIFDEIQACPRALSSLKYFQETMPELAICSAGSLLGVHLGYESFPVGKVEVIDLFPMSFFEFLEALDEMQALEFLVDWNFDKQIPLSLHNRLWEKLKFYFIVGGMPEVVQEFVQYQENHLIAFEKVRERQKQLLIAYFSDIAKHSGKANAMHVERVFHGIPSQLAKSQNGNVRRFQFKGLVPNIDKYSRLASAIDWLEAAHLILKLAITNRAEIPFKAFTKESFFKLLVFDVGILGAMSSLPAKSILDYDYGTYKGYFAENFVAQELLCSGYDSLHSWEEGRSEIEFLLEKDGKPMPVEVKSGWISKAQSLSKFNAKYKPEKSIILSAKEFKIHNGLIHLPLYLAGKI